MQLDYSEPRCTGNWLGVNGEFGKTLNPDCIDCQRRLQTEHHQFRQAWMQAEAFDGVCRFKITRVES